MSFANIFSEGNRAIWILFDIVLLQIAVKDKELILCFGLDGEFSNIRNISIAVLHNIMNSKLQAFVFL